MTPHRLTRALLAVCATAGFVLAGQLNREVLRGQSVDNATAEATAVSLAADVAHEWQDEHGTVMLLRGRCRITQNNTTLRARQMVVWRRTERTGRGVQERLFVYAEGDVRLDRPGRSLSDAALTVNLVTKDGVDFELRDRVAGDSLEHDPLFRRADERRRSTGRRTLVQTQLVVPSDDAPLPELSALQLPVPQGTQRRIRFFPRSATNFNILSFKSTQTTPPEQIWVLDGGVNLLIDSVDVEGFDDLGTIDISADRMVVWTRTREEGQFQLEMVQSRDEPFQVYLEGNIVVRQGQNIVRAATAYYDAREERALIEDAELRAFIPQLGGHLRVRAARMRQLARNRYHAQNAWVSASRFGKPGYRIQASDIFYDERAFSPWLGVGAAIDPITGAPAAEATPWVTSLNNTFFVEDVPLFYAPYLSGPGEDANIPVRSVSIGQDNIFGGQLETVWNMPKVLGLDLPPGVEWDGLVDYFTERGPGVGTRGRYQGADLFGIPGIYAGEGLAYYIHDDGEDNLGMDRLNLIPETSDRWRLQLRHRQTLPYQMTLQGEIGFLSDRNFLEQYYEPEFDKGKDVETLLYLKQDVDNWAWTLLGRPQVNEFETTTAWLPKGDLYALSEPLFDGWLNWSSHSSAGYAQLRQGDVPTDPADTWSALPFIAEADGGVLMTRHELDAPFNLGPVKVVPYAMGEGAYWSDGFTADEVERLVGSAGVRSSLMFWRLFPQVHSRIFNLNGLAHKVTLEGEYAYTDSSESLSNIPQFNEFDDNAQERFRQRFLINTFGGMMLPPVVEPRFYAVRSGTGWAVTSPYHELIDDQQVFRMNVRHRLQTKVGPPERMRIKDWMTLDTGTAYFPRAVDDNFGEDVGLVYADYRWNVGDRTSLSASAFYDLFDGGQQLWSLGMVSQRSTRGSVYLGVRQVEGGGFDSRILTASYSYAMSEKWISTAGTAYDLAENRNRGQSLTITRVGADFLVHVGANYDESKDNVGIAVSIEPRIGPFDANSPQLSSLLGLR